MNRFFFTVMLLLIPFLSSVALEGGNQFRSVLEQARLIHYSGRTEEAAETVSRLNTMSAFLEKSSEALTDSEYSVLQSEFLLYKGLLLLDLEEKERASEVLSEGIDLCDAEYSRGNEFFFLVQGALLKSHWMLLQKTSVLIKTGAEIQDMTDLALEMDGDDFTSRLLSAQGLINAPQLFGGDPEEAARLLQSSEELAENEYDRFDLYLSLADARRKKKDWEDAARWCTQALFIFPQNSKALEMQDLIRRKKK